MPRKVCTGSHADLKHKMKRDNISKTNGYTHDKVSVRGFMAAARRQTPYELQAPSATLNGIFYIGKIVRSNN